MSEKKSERKKKAWNELIDKHCKLNEDNVIDEMLHVDYVVEIIADVASEGIDKGIDLANEMAESETKPTV